MCVAFIKNALENQNSGSDKVIRNYIDYIENKQFRLSDGTLARNRPQQNTLWLDDMFMGIPALAWMGKYSGETKYFDEAARQVRLFAKRMFVPEKDCLCMAGYKKWTRIQRFSGDAPTAGLF
jgi:rhamnogalacturonyl hydrolase YesR